MRKTASIFVALILLLALVACGGGNSSAPATPTSPGSTTTPSSPSTSTPTTPSTPAPAEPTGPKYGGTLRMTTTSTLENPFGIPWKYILTGNPTTPYAEPFLLERPTGEVFPFLAKSWEIDLDNLEIRFQLRDDVLFSDGSRFNAEAVVWNMENYIDVKLITNTIIGAEARGEFEVAILLSDFSNTLLATFGSRGTAMISKEAFFKNGEDYSLNNPIGTGPFRLKERIPGIKVVFESRDDYWQPGKPYLDFYEYIAMTDPMTQVAALMAGEIDVLSTSSGEQVATLRETADIYVNSMTGATVSLFPDSKNPDSVLSILEIRQAIAYAIDREAIVDARGFGIWRQGVQLIPAPFPGYLPDSYDLNYDPARSKELLAKAGYPNGINIPLHAAATIDRDAIVAVQNMLSQVGINCDLNFPESGAVTDLRNNGWNGLLVGSFSPLSNMVSTFRLTVDPIENYYVSTFRPAGYEGMIDIARATPTVEPPLVQDLHKLFLDNMTIIPVYGTSSNYVISNRVHDGGFAEWSVGTQWLPQDIWVD